MDWDMKTPSWDLAELERDAGLNIGSVVDSTGGLVRQRSAVDCSVDLKLGGLGDFGSSEKWKGPQHKAWSAPVVTSTTTAGASLSGPSKRPRQPSNITQNASCLVDGCTSDLSNCREYHRRHKVCEAHSKTPIVMVGGQEQRFCQQCSRFHHLAEFDEVKRSCRKRLDGHNRRRRKPQPESISATGLLPSFQGSRFQSYPHIFPTATPHPNWTGVLKNGEDALYQQHQPLHGIDRQHFSTSYTLNFKEGKQFPFLHDNGTTISSRTIEATTCQPLLNTISFSGNSSSNNNKLFPDGLTQVLDSDCALSLLSSRTQTSGINLSHVVPSDRIQVAQPLVQSLQQYGDMSRYSRSQGSSHVSTNGFSCSRVDEQVATVLVSDTCNTDLHCQGFFQLGGEGSSSGPSGSVPFSWQ